MRRTLAVLVCMCLPAACTDGTERQTRRAQPSPSPTAGTAWELPARCGTLPRPSAQGQISFVAEGTLFVASPDGDVACGGPIDVSGSLSWSGTGRRALAHSPDEVTVTERSDTTSIAGQAAAVGFSRPTGTSVLHISPDRRSLFKTSLEDIAEARDISFLEFTDHAAYHPAGTHIVASGLARDGTYGVYLADNLGRDPQPIARGESFEGDYDPDEPRITELAWSHSGDTLYFGADHGDVHHLHSLSLNEVRGELVQGGFEVLATGPEPIEDVRVSEFTGRRLVAFGRGDCAAGFRTSVIVRQRDPQPLHELPGSTLPVGWLPDGRLVLASSERGCEAASDLYMWSEGSSRALISDVSLAAVRARLPEPPDPPSPVGEQVVA